MFGCAQRIILLQHADYIHLGQLFNSQSLLHLLQMGLKGKILTFGPDRFQDFIHAFQLLLLRYAIEQVSHIQRRLLGGAAEWGKCHFGPFR